MVRPEERETPAMAEGTRSGRVEPAGASPAPVSVGAPGSRPQPSSREAAGRAGRQEPVRWREPRSGEQARGPQHQVKPAASSHLQWESRAEHLAAKATFDAPGSGQIRASSLLGVQGAARVQGTTRNRRDPSALPSSRQGVSYKPMAKSSAAQRESEGLVVPSMVVTNNATGGKGPCFGHARSEGKREGMAAKSGPNHPGARWCDDKVRQPQRELWAGAERRDLPRHRVANHRRGDARRCTWGRDANLVVHAPSRRPSVSRVPEIGTHGLKGGSALSPMNNRSSR